MIDRKKETMADCDIQCVCPYLKTRADVSEAVWKKQQHFLQTFSDCKREVKHQLTSLAVYQDVSTKKILLNEDLLGHRASKKHNLLSPVKAFAHTSLRMLWHSGQHWLCERLHVIFRPWKLFLSAQTGPLNPQSHHNCSLFSLMCFKNFKPF